MSSSIGKILGGAVNNSLEISPALANFNFDFSLCKVEPPEEFQRVGASLSTFRRDEAENGLPHITARKLGALFQRVIPSTPRLLEAYGRRASEISESTSIDDEKRNTIYGVFASRVGADATSLWAAATSGAEAIAVHLLACMLAKMWEGSEATSIWVEIIARRKQEILQEFDEKSLGDMASLLAAKQELSREQVARWDASARAWLRAADAIKMRQVKQLVLILDNAPRPVNQKKDTYESVMSAWKSSLIQMEDLIKGISRRAEDGAILLALGAWHLFPDMVIVDPVAHIQQGDTIFSSGGVLTIGLEKHDTLHTGVFWSLPLAHLRHYGAPVISEQTIDSSVKSRITPDELLLATLGCILEGWGRAGLHTLRAITWLSSIHDLVHNELKNSCRNAKRLAGVRTSWFILLTGAAKFYLSTTGTDRSVANKLISVGRRHGKRFIALPAQPVFGLIHRGAYVHLMKEPEDQIQHLRSVAECFRNSTRMGVSEISANQIFIRYKRTIQFGDNPSETKSVYEYTTALPWTRQGTKRDEKGGEKTCSGHCRWLYAGGHLERISSKVYYQRLDYHFKTRPANVPKDFSEWHRTRFTNFSEEPSISDRVEFSSDQYEYVQKEFFQRAEFFSSKGEEVWKRDDQFIEDFAPSKMGVYWPRPSVEPDNTSFNTPFYSFLYGDIGSAALFVVEGEGRLPIDLVRTVEEDTTAFFDLFSSDRLNTAVLMDELLSTFMLINTEFDPYYKSLRAISTVAHIYAKFPKTSIDIRVLQLTLFTSKWIPGFQLLPVYVVNRDSTLTPVALQPYFLSLEQTFACIAMFDSGLHDLDTDSFKNVMALSSGDTIYVAATLLADPSFVPSSGDIKQIPGNIGHPGIALLRPPSAPMIKEVQLADWKESISDPFDGSVRDSFKNTSLHLSFTGATFPVDTGFSGGQDIEVYILETLISIHDHGKWIADLDVLRMYGSQHLHRLLGEPCEHDENEMFSPDLNVASIDNWFAMIDTQYEFNFVRAHKNWQARLAAAALSVALGYENVIVLPEKICWGCVNSKANNHPYNTIPADIRSRVSVMFIG